MLKKTHFPMDPVLTNSKPDSNRLYKLIMRKIALLLNAGWHYEEVLRDTDLNTLYEAHREKLFRNGITVTLEQLVLFIFTRDLPGMDLGSWIKIDVSELLNSFYFVYQRKKNKENSLHPIKVAGFLIALGQFAKNANTNKLNIWLSNIDNKLRRGDGYRDSLLKRKRILETGLSSGDLIVINKPERFYNLANISQLTFKQTADSLDVKYEYDNYNNDGLKTRLFIWNYEQVISSVNDNQSSFNILSNDLLLNVYKNYASDSFICEPFNNADWKLICEKFTRRYINNYSWHLTRKAPGNFPYYRLDKQDSKIYLFAPEKLFNYKIAFSLLFGGYVSQLSQLGITIERRTLSNLKTELNALLKSLIDSGVLNDCHLLNSVNYLFNNKTNHFTQIEKVHPIVNQMSQNGIQMDLEKLNEIDEGNFKCWIEKYDQVALIEKFGSIDENEIIKRLKYENEHSTIEIRDIYDHLMYSSNSNRIFGSFTTHKAGTHRMTCHNYNLQGISKEIREHVFTAKKGWRLLNADVSGQDLVVAANLALKLYSDPSAKVLLPDKDIIKLKSQIKTTIKKLGNKRLKKHKPIDYILDLIMPDLLIENNSLDRGTIRNLLKEVQFSILYGGGKKTVLKNLTNDAELEFYLSGDANKVDKIIDRWKLKKKLKNTKYLIESINDIKSLLEGIEHDVIFNPSKEDPALVWEEHIGMAEEIAGPGGAASELNKIMHQSESIQIQKDLDFIAGLIDYLVPENLKRLVKKLYDAYTEQITNEYPGIIESLEFYKEYCATNNYQTYPSLLGYQTVIDGKSPNKENGRLVSTRGKSYPVQISSAEFMRQWLIEIAKDKAYNKDFIIVNAIHDQVYVEVKAKAQKSAKDLIKSSSKRAAKIVGIVPESLHITF